jgi:tetratricopeptide (TPR) repeat protein
MISAPLVLLLAAAASPVTVREEALSIPTWEIGPPSLHPLYPGPQAAIYPYTLNDVLTDRKLDRAYRAVFLENEYVQVLVLPEIGGRVHGALDKTNGYKWLYWQPTIKPGLISMTGAWISGGIEWNFPHGHRPSGFMPVDYRVVRHDDGSATVWVGETEPIYRMRWLVGITLEPGRSFFRCEYVFVNPTLARHPFQFWATSATHANEWSQAQYPGDVMTGHGKQEFWRWPVDNGVDLSWWKNVPNASSFFAWESKDDWFGTYDHRAKGGLVHVADHRVMPGKKLWTWGSGPSGRIWEDILTEGGGAYFEPQAGAFSDNQPDYHWLEPGEVRRAKDVWYPVRDIGGYRYANEDFAVNVDVKDGKVTAGVYATGAFDGVRVTLAAGSGQPLLEKTVRIAPDQPFLAEAVAPAGLTLHDLRLSVRDASGRLAVDYAAKRPGETPLPPPVETPPGPKGLALDPLLRWGEWLDRFVRREEALGYYEEAVKRFPADPRAHLELGWIALQQTRYEDGLRALDAAAAAGSADARLQLGRGLALAGLGRDAEAYAALERAGSGAPALVALARLDLGRGDAKRAVERLAAAERANDTLAEIPALRAAALRVLGQAEAALAAAERALALDAMNFLGAREKTLALRALRRPDAEWERTRAAFMRDSVQNEIELACAYLSAGLAAEADAVLAAAVVRVDSNERRPFSAARFSPMVHYLRGLARERAGDAAGAAESYAAGARVPLDYANPHRAEELAALDAALRRDPRDAHALHLLGNLLYGFGRKADGLARWKQAVALDPKLALTWRNVAYGERQVNADERAAAAAYAQAFALAPGDARVLLELDQTAERLAAPAPERLARLRENRRTVDGRDDLTFRWIDLELADGSPAGLEAVRQTLTTRHFHSWEGSYGIHHAFVEVNQRLGDLALARGDLEGALALYRAAFEYPKNLEVAPRTPDLQAHLNWKIASALVTAGRRDEALPYLDKVLAEPQPQPNLATYYQALALRAKGDEAGARERLVALEQRAKQMTGESGADRRGRAETTGYYLLALAREAQGDAAGAEAARRKATERDPRAARVALTAAQIEYASARQ